MKTTPSSKRCAGGGYATECACSVCALTAPTVDLQTRGQQVPLALRRCTETRTPGCARGRGRGRTVPAGCAVFGNRRRNVCSLRCRRGRREVGASQSSRPGLSRPRADYRLGRRADRYRRRVVRAVRAVCACIHAGSLLPPCPTSGFCRLGNPHVHAPRRGVPIICAAGVLISCSSSSCRPFSCCRPFCSPSFCSLSSSSRPSGRWGLQNREPREREREERVRQRW